MSAEWWLLFAGLVILAASDFVTYVLIVRHYNTLLKATLTTARPNTAAGTTTRSPSAVAAEPVCAELLAAWRVVRDAQPVVDDPAAAAALGTVKDAAATLELYASAELVAALRPAMAALDRLAGVRFRGDSKLVFDEAGRDCDTKRSDLLVAMRSFLDIA